jgi:hypothetical protein
MFDVKDKDGKYSHSKVLCVATTGITTLLTAIAIWRGTEFTWPLAAVLVALLYAPYGLDAIKAVAKMRFNAN